MSRLWWHLRARFCEARARRAYRRYVALRKKAEEFFRRRDADFEEGAE